MTSELKYTVLGPVRAWRGTVELNLGAPQQRAVLAMLLLARGRQVNLDTLINGLWEEDPPPAAVGTIRTYVSRLRHVLEAGGDEGTRQPIRSAGTGYVLAPSAGRLDLDAFEQLTAEARELNGGHPQERAGAAALLRDALQLGRGEPLADLPGPAASRQRMRLSELQLAANEELLALDVDLGRHMTAVAELQTLLACYPMRERLSELLMLALYRAGRQIDALTAFDDARRLLADEFGVDPGPALRNMQQRILQTDESLISPPKLPVPRRTSDAAPDGPGSAAAPATVAPVLVVPAQLPADLPVFAGRSGELARLDDILGDTARSAEATAIAAIDGVAGTGKTSLAIHWARRVADRFPDGQLYVDLRGYGPEGSSAAAESVLRGFLAALGVPAHRVPSDLDGQASLYRSMLRGRRFLMLLDNAREMAQVRPLLPGTPGCLVVVTSRSQLVGLVAAHGARTITLDSLPTAEARKLLEARVGPARLAAEPQAVKEIVDRCAGLPLALAVIATSMAVYQDLPLAEIASELRNAGSGLDAFSLGEPSADVRTAFSWSYEALSEPARRLFRLLSAHCGQDISKNAVPGLAGLTRAEAQPLLAELTSVRLLTEQHPGRFVVHELVRAYGAELSAALSPPAGRDAALAEAA